MRRFITSLVICFALFSQSAVADIIRTHQEGSCTVKFDETISLDMASAALGLSMRGGNIDPFLWGHLCEWRPNSTFLIFGKDGGGFFQPTLSNRPDSKEFLVSVNICSFRMEFSYDGESMYRTDERRKCDAPSSSQGRGGVDQIIPQTVDGAYSVICKDGSAGTLTQSSPPVWCAATLDGERNQCSGETSRGAMAEWMCR